MKKLLLILLCLPMIGFGQNDKLYKQQKEKNKKNRIQKKEDKNNYFRELNESTAKNNFVIRAGFSMADIRDGDDWYSFKQDNKLGNKFGLFAAIDGMFSIKDRVDLDASLRFSQKTLKTDPVNYTNITGCAIIGAYAYLNKINFIDINTNISYKLTNRISFSSGPYISYAINGKQKMITFDPMAFGGFGIPGVPTSSFLPPDDTIWTSINFDNPDYPKYESQVSRLDYGLDIGLSYLIAERIQLKTNYSLGFSDLHLAAENIGEKDYSQKTSVFYLTIGYLFNNAF